MSSHSTFLRNVVTVTNKELRSTCGHTGVCILGAAVLVDVLTQLSIPVRELRVEASVSMKSDNPRHYGCLLGSDGDGTRQPASDPGMWKGHLVVVANERFLLDATLDQVNRRNPWLAAKPFIGEVTPEFLHGKPMWFGREGRIWQPLASWQTPWPSTTVRYTAFPGRGGYKNAPDWRPSHRRELVRRVLAHHPRIP